MKIVLRLIMVGVPLALLSFGMSTALLQPKTTYYLKWDRRVGAALGGRIIDLAATRTKAYALVGRPTPGWSSLVEIDLETDRIKELNGFYLAAGLVVNPNDWEILVLAKPENLAVGDPSHHNHAVFSVDLQTENKQKLFEIGPHFTQKPGSTIAFDPFGQILINNQTDPAQGGSILVRTRTGEDAGSFGDYLDMDSDNRRSMLRSIYNFRQLVATPAGLVASNPFTQEVAIYGRSEGPLSLRLPMDDYLPVAIPEPRLTEDGAVESPRVLGEVSPFYDRLLFIQFTSRVRESGTLLGIVVNEYLDIVGEVRLSSHTQPWETSSTYQHAVFMEKNAYLLADSLLENRIDLFRLSAE